MKPTAIEMYAAFYDNEAIMGFAFPREERDALVASEPDKFQILQQAYLRATDSRVVQALAPVA